MRHETATLIAETAAEYGREVEVRADYSGRGMYGKATAAVVGNRVDIEVSVLWAAYCLGAGASDADGDDPEAAEAMNDLEGLRWDQMGRDDHVCY